MRRPSKCTERFLSDPRVHCIRTGEGQKIAKCANPACRVRFELHIGGKFFRFNLDDVEVVEIPGATENSHHVIHYWLCPVCSKIFSLAPVEDGKVILRLVEDEFASPPPEHELTAA